MVKRLEGKTATAIAMFERARGNTRFNLRKIHQLSDKPHPSRWNHGPPWRPNAIGSQNIRPAREAALGDQHFHRKMARAWDREGIWGRELGSALYSGGVATSFLQYIAEGRDGSRSRPKSLLGFGHPASEMMARSWCFWSLVTTPVTFQSVDYFEEGNLKKLKGERRYYPLGCSVAMSGDRWNPAAVGNPTYDKIHAWALNLERNFSVRLNRWQDLKYRNDVLENPPNNLQVPYFIDLLTLQHLFNQPYENHVPAPFFGMNDDLRSILKAMVSPRVETAIKNCAEIAHILEYTRVNKKYRFFLGRTTDSVFSFPMHYANMNKPSMSFARVDMFGHATFVRNMPWGSKRWPRVRFDRENQELLLDRPGHLHQIDMSRLLAPSKLLWLFEADSTGTRPVDGAILPYIRTGKINL